MAWLGMTSGQRCSAFGLAIAGIAIVGAIGQGALNRSAAPPPRSAAKASLFGGEPSASRREKVSLNKADQAGLESLPGIGPVFAGRILELRRQRGSFRSIDELLDVKGIRPDLVERLRPLVTL
ncbi:MAG: helix-hairpin-helix domain-containing protein [Fimbriimonadaceae bacterium]|nr:helix-hairpin-helix domain-containing protein [Fimbriimonadaceae bacterium]QYK55772.1 MAG: helix-hairpin-helix domain-containing protein [Fimbriimonadaceae bacterium]